MLDHAAKLGRMGIKSQESEPDSFVRHDLEITSELDAARLRRRQRRTRALGDVAALGRLFPVVNGGAENFNELRRT
jgi:hypothetical protein